MARISTYGVSSPTELTDELLGSDIAKATKNFTVGSIIDITGIPAGTDNTLSMFGPGPTLVNSIITQNTAGTVMSIGQDDTQEVTTEATLNIQGPVKDSTGSLGNREQVLVSNASGNLFWENYQGTGLEYQSAWNAATDVPDLTAIVLDDTNTGKYWVVSTAGTTNLGGITDWNPGDWAIISQNDAGAVFWDHIDNSGLDGVGITDRLTIWTSATTLGSAPVKLGTGTDSLVFNNIGNNLASGNNSFASGFTTTASGGASTAMGHSTVASGVQSTALGYNSNATGDVSIAIGNSSTASGVSSVALGFTTRATGNTSTAMGNNTRASGTASTALGLYSAASGVSSTATGYDTDASGANSTSTGRETTASGVNSTAMGLQTTADGFGTTAVGTYNTIDAAAVPLTFDAANRAFVIGIGKKVGAVITREDAFTVKYDGTTYYTQEAKFNKNVIVDDKIGIRIANPQRELDVDGGVRIRHTLDLFQGNDNTFAGTDAGNLFNITAGSNTGFGKNSQAVNISGSSNTSMGLDSLGALVTGNGNTAIGTSSMTLSNNGSQNVALGSYSLASATSGNGNTAIGHNSLGNKTTTNFNTAVGIDSLANITTGFRNVAVGNSAGKYTSDGTTANATGTTSVFIGSDAKSAASAQSNQIVIGYEAIGKGSNTAVIGNNSTTALHVGGDNAGIVLKSPNGTAYTIRVTDAGALVVS